FEYEAETTIIIYSTLQSTQMNQFEG
ncbi:uncharacterized protein METZ01_LOCUS495836, partial [marine metagenome]